jgi:hypothetical protein
MTGRRATRATLVAHLLACLACVACKKSEPPPPAADLPTLSASEVQRGRDACAAYVAKVCACAEAVPAMKEPCALARPLAEAIQVGADVSAGSDATRRDALQANASVRTIVKKCIEETARLPAAGCP